MNDGWRQDTGPGTARLSRQVLLRTYVCARKTREGEQASGCARTAAEKSGRSVRRGDGVFVCAAKKTQKKKKKNGETQKPISFLCDDGEEKRECACGQCEGEGGRAFAFVTDWGWYISYIRMSV